MKKLMKKIFRRAGRAIKPLVNVPRWVSYSTIQSTAQSFGEFGKKLFVPKRAIRKETFREAMERLGLTENDLVQRARQLLVLMFAYMAIAGGLFILALYLFFVGKIGGGVAGLTVTFLACVFVFREHFWYFQIKRRKLGCTFKDWLDYCFKRDQSCLNS